MAKQYETVPVHGELTVGHLLSAADQAANDLFGGEVDNIPVVLDPCLTEDTNIDNMVIVGVRFNPETKALHLLMDTVEEEEPE